jgi:hypothetical protein
VSALSIETLAKAELFDYLCWLEEKEQHERVPNADFLCLASDGTTCWGKTYADAVKVAFHHDKGLQDASPPNTKVSDGSEPFAGPIGSGVRPTTHKQSEEK